MLGLMQQCGNVIKNQGSFYPLCQPQYFCSISPHDCKRAAMAPSIVDLQDPEQEVRRHMSKQVALIGGRGILQCLGECWVISTGGMLMTSSRKRPRM